MAAIDYPYDPTGESPDNWVSNEVHSLEHSAAVFPQHGAFFRERSIVEVSNNGVDWIALEPMTRYRYSPLWMRASAAIGKEIHSYFVIYGDWKEARISYQAFGQFEDRDLLEQVATSTFDRKDPSAWLAIKGCMSFNPIIRKPHWQELQPIEVLNAGVEEILDELRRMTVGCDKATLQQMTQLEIRQSQIETAFGNIDTEFNQIRERYGDIEEQFDQLNDFFVNGWGGNMSYSGGFTYNSTEPLSQHVITHGLNTQDVFTTFWTLNEDGLYETLENAVEVLDDNTVQVTFDTPARVIGVIQPLSADGIKYESPGPATAHTVNHNLDTGFPNVAVYRLNDQGRWETFTGDVTQSNRSVMELNLLQAETLKVLIEPPVTNNFIWASDTPSTQHLIPHRLGTLYLGAQYWVRDANGIWHQDIIGATLLNPGQMRIDLGEQRDVRVILSPVALEGPNWEQNLHTRLTQVEVKFDDLSNALDKLRQDVESGSIGGGGVGDSHIYYEETPKTLHEITHSLDSMFVSLTSWMRNADGSWTEVDLSYTWVDSNNITIETTTPVALRVRVRGEDV